MECRRSLFFYASSVKFGVEAFTMNDDALVKSVVAWEWEWFRKVSSFPPESSTRSIALRILRHAIWYLRSRH